MAKPDAETFEGIAGRLVARQRLGLGGDRPLQQEVHPSCTSDADRLLPFDFP